MSGSEIVAFAYLIIVLCFFFGLMGYLFGNWNR